MPSAGPPAVASCLPWYPRQQLDHLLADPVEVGAELDQHLGGDALALADQAEQDVLGADVVVAQLQRFAQAEFEDLLGTRGEGDVPGRRLLALADDLLDLLANAFERNAQTLESLGRDALSLVDQPEQDVLGADVVVVEHAGLFLGQHDHPAGSVGKSLEHVSSLLMARSVAQPDVLRLRTPARLLLACYPRETGEPGSARVDSAGRTGESPARSSPPRCLSPWLSPLLHRSCAERANFLGFPSLGRSAAVSGGHSHTTARGPALFHPVTTGVPLAANTR